MLRVSLVAASCAAALVLCPAASARTATASDRPAAARADAGAVVGAVVDARDQAVADAPLRLRDVTTGRIQSTGRSNESGQFRFENVDGGQYIVEVVDRAGAVLAVGRTFDVVPGETVATVVRLAGRTRWFAGFFANAAAAAVASAASLGVTAVAPTGQAVSGVR